MTSLLDFFLNLFRDPEAGAQFVADSDAALCTAGFSNVSEAQLNTMALAAAPAGLALNHSNAVVGLQSAVADHHNIASPFSPTTVYAPSPTFAPQTNTEVLSHNDTNVEVASPDQVSGANSQSGGFNFAIGDITLGDKTTTTQTASDGGVIVNGENDVDIQTVNDVETGDHSPVVVGDDNDLEDNSSTETNVAGDDIIADNEGPVISEVDMSGGDSGDVEGGDSLIGIGSGNASSGNAGNGGSIVIVDQDNDTTTTTQTVNTVVVEPEPHPFLIDPDVIDPGFAELPQQAEIAPIQEPLPTLDLEPVVGL